jgi:hypothetical protein
MAKFPNDTGLATRGCAAMNCLLLIDGPLFSRKVAKSGIFDAVVGLLHRLPISCNIDIYMIEAPVKLLCNLAAGVAFSEQIFNCGACTAVIETIRKYFDAVETVGRAELVSCRLLDHLCCFIGAFCVSNCAEESRVERAALCVREGALQLIVRLMHVSGSDAPFPVIAILSLRHLIMCGTEVNVTAHDAARAC